MFVISAPRRALYCGNNSNKPKIGNPNFFVSLAATSDGAGNNPIYTEPYGQFDLSVGYKVTKNLTLQADLINLNDGVIRQHGRTTEQLISVTQTGRRYQAGLRYRF